MEDSNSSPEREELKKQIKAISDILKLEFKLTVKEISKETLVTESTLADYKRGKIPYKNLDVPYAVLAKLDKLEKKMRFHKNGKPKSIPVADGYPDPGSLPSVSEPKAIALRILLDLTGQNAPEPYDGDFELVGYPFKKDGKHYMILDPNDSKRLRNAVGVVPSYAPGWTGFEFGIKWIKIKNCIWGKHYYIWDVYYQAYYVSLYDIKEQPGYYKLVHDDPVKYPDKTLHESEILVVLQVTIRLFPN